MRDSPSHICLFFCFETIASTISHSRLRSPFFLPSFPSISRCCTVVNVFVLLLLVIPLFFLTRWIISYTRQISIYIFTYHTVVVPFVNRTYKITKNPLSSREFKSLSEEPYTRITYSKYIIWLSMFALARARSKTRSRMYVFYVHVRGHALPKLRARARACSSIHIIHVYIYIYILYIYKVQPADTRQQRKAIYTSYS